MVTVTRTTSQEVDTRFFKNTLLDGSGKTVVDGAKSVYQNSRTVDNVQTLYRQRIPKGIGCTTYMQGTRYVIDRAPEGIYSSEQELYSQGKLYATQRYRFFGDLWTTSMPSFESAYSNLAQANNSALMEFYERIREAQTSFQGVVFAGELGEALRMIRSPAKSLRELVFGHRGRVKKRVAKDRYNPRAVRRTAAGMWLEASFGWRPLISDIHAGCEALAKVMTYTPDRVPVRGSGEVKRTVVGGTEFFREFGPIKMFLGPVRTEYTASVRYYGSVGMPTGDTLKIAFINTFQRTGLTFRDVVPALWELIPYSFLVDYFTNVGAIIDAFSIGTSNLKWVSKGQLLQASSQRNYLRPVTFTVNRSDLKTKNTIFSPGRPSVMTSRSITRSPVLDLGLPSLEFKVPGMSTKWINIAALLAAKDTDRAFIGRRG